MKTRENEFYLRDTRSNTGSSCMFWAEGGRGYTTNLDKAEVFNFEDAQRHADRRGHFIPLSKMQVDELTTVRVDMQRLALNADFSKGVINHVRVGRYDGNDIFFDGESGVTANYNEAKVYTEEEFKNGRKHGIESGAALSKAFLDTICRRTIQAGNIDHKKMVTAAGIKYRPPRKERKTSGKTCHNCPSCGRIAWSYNPYDAPLCFNCE